MPLCNRRVHVLLELIGTGRNTIAQIEFGESRRLSPSVREVISLRCLVMN